MTTVCPHLRLSREPESPSKQGAFAWADSWEKLERWTQEDSAHCCWLWRWRRSHARQRKNPKGREHDRQPARNSDRQAPEWVWDAPEPPEDSLTPPGSWFQPRELEPKPLELWDNKRLLISTICSKYWLSNGKPSHYAFERTCPYSLATSKTFKT